MWEESTFNGSRSVTSAFNKMAKHSRNQEQKQKLLAYLEELPDEALQALLHILLAQKTASTDQLDGSQ